METTYDVRIWKIRPYKGKATTTYRVRWKVATREFRESFATMALADSFRSDLVAAARRGDAFHAAEGLPVSMLRAEEAMPWYGFACAYMDMKWPDASPGHRRTIVDALVPITMAMMTRDRRMPAPRLLRRALRLGLNPKTRDREHTPAVADALQWVARNSRQVRDLAQPNVLRDVVAQIEMRLDGQRAALDTVRLRRTTLANALNYAVERNALSANPLAEVKVRKRKTVLRQVDRRAVVNPMQARMLLQAVSELGKSGPPLVAFFGLMYYAALRPEEAASIKKHNLSLPSTGWGEIHLERAAPEIAAEWTDSGIRSEERGLKHREDNTGRTVPCPPALTELLHDHVNAYGVGRDGRLFRGARDGGRIGSTTYGRVWARARAAVFTPDVVASPLAKRPYDLRHAAVSTWLNAGVEATRVAEWAGHSLSVLLRVYAKCLDGGEQVARDRVQSALQGW